MSPPLRRRSDDERHPQDGGFSARGKGLFWTGIVGTTLCLLAMLLLLLPHVFNNQRVHPVRALVDGMTPMAAFVVLIPAFLTFMVLMIVGFTKWTTAGRQHPRDEW